MTDVDEHRVSDLPRLIEVTVSELRPLRMDRANLRRALVRYFRRGYLAGVSTGELVDVLGVSSPSILDRAGFSSDQADRAMSLVGDLSDTEISGGPTTS